MYGLESVQIVWMKRNETGSAIRSNYFLQKGPIKLPIPFVKKMNDITQSYCYSTMNLF